MPSPELPVDEFEQALLNLDRLTAARLLSGTDDRSATEPMSITQLREALIVPALTDIGSAWERGDVALSQVYMSGRLCQEIIEAASPAVCEGTEGTTIAIGVLEDAHTLGKTIVTHLLRACGHAVRDLGARLTVDDMVREVDEHRIETLMVSVLMLRSALLVQQLREALDLRLPGTLVVVGGAPFRFDPELWTEVGADHVGFSASDALTIVERIGAAV